MIRRKREDELAPREYWRPYSWSPLTMLDEMDRLFDDFRSGFENYMIAPGNLATEALRAPAVDLIDEGKEYKLQAEMPGIAKKDINIEVTENELEISAELKEEKQEEDVKAGYIKRERRFSKFYRRIPLPESVDSENVEADLKDGILTVKLPKITPPAKKVKKIGVK